MTKGLGSFFLSQCVGSEFHSWPLLPSLSFPFHFSPTGHYSPCQQTAGKSVISDGWHLPEGAELPQKGKRKSSFWCKNSSIWTGKNFCNRQTALLSTTGVKQLVDKDFLIFNVICDICLKILRWINILEMFKT